MSTILPALDHDCPFCGATAGLPCRAHRGKGRELERSHSRRIDLARTDRYVTPIRQALCCECGQVSEFKQARNWRGWFGDNSEWHRELGDLKCDQCGSLTPHALLSADPDRHRDEEMQRAALGEDVGGWDYQRLRREYRQGPPAIRTFVIAIW
jgi:hypothetical protein